MRAAPDLGWFISVLVVAGLLTRAFVGNSAARLNVDGVEPGMTLWQVGTILGAPMAHTDGCLYYRTGTRVCFANAMAHEEVFSVTGHTLRRGDETVAQLGDGETQLRTALNLQLSADRAEAIQLLEIYGVDDQAYQAWAVDLVASRRRTIRHTTNDGRAVVSLRMHDSVVEDISLSTSLSNLTYYPLIRR